MITTTSALLLLPFDWSNSVDRRALKAFFNINYTVSLSNLLLRAACVDLIPLSFSILTLAPFWSRADTTAEWHTSIMASMSGVFPSLPFASMSQPSSKSSRTILSRPCLAAMWSALLPHGFLLFLRVSLRRSHSTKRLSSSNMSRYNMHTNLTFVSIGYFKEVFEYQSGNRFISAVVDVL